MVSPRTPGIIFQEMNYIEQRRISYMELDSIYFWTATINNWYRLLEHHTVKQILIDSLYYLHQHHKIEVYGFVIMPNHLHFLWKIKEMNGKETPQGSFLKYTAHNFKKYLSANNPSFLKAFAVEAA